MAESFTVTREWMALLKSLPTDEMRLHIIMAVADYALDNIEPAELTDVEKGIFKSMKATVQNRNKRNRYYTNHKDEKLQCAVTMCRYNVPLQCNHKSDELPLNIDDGLSNTRKSIDSNSTKTLKENYIFLKEQKDIIQEKVRPAEPKKRTVFVPPTLEEVREYCKFRRNAVNPEQFMARYESNGWMVGRNKMKDWKAAVRYWEQKMYEDRKTLSQKRDYSGI